MQEVYSTDEIDTKLSTIQLTPGPQGIPGVAGATGATGPAGANGKDGLNGTGGHGLWLEDMPGTSDDDKLDAAIAKAQNGAVCQPILLSNRVYTFSKNRTAFSGLKLINPYGFGDQARGANSIPTLVKFTGSGAWWTFPSGNTFDVQFSGFGAQGNKNSVAFVTASGAIAWTSLWRDLGFTEWSSVWGTPTQPFINDAILIDGFININNSYNTAGTFGGSDSSLFMGFTLIDTPTAYSASNPGHYQLIFSSQSKTEIGPIYMTAEGCKGVLFKGSTNGRTTFYHPKVEGRNANAASTGPLIEIQGGQILIDKAWLGYTKGEFVLQSGGYVLLDAPNFGAATGGPTQVLTQTGGTASILNASATWATVPTTKGSNIGHDNSVS